MNFLFNPRFNGFDAIALILINSLIAKFGYISLLLIIPAVIVSVIGERHANT